MIHLMSVFPCFKKHPKGYRCVLCSIFCAVSWGLGPRENQCKCHKEEAEGLLKPNSMLPHSLLPNNLASTSKAGRREKMKTNFKPQAPSRCMYNGARCGVWGHRGLMWTGGTAIKTVNTKPSVLCPRMACIAYWKRITRKFSKIISSHCSFTP